tara:strand:- start:223 stop:627 length:405 start_codon:yes stop_codon:yes gene_type:complete
MNEKQLQSKIVLDFSQKMPDYRGCLWSTRNTTFSQRDGQTQKAMGMFAGVSDLILFFECRFIGLEVKTKGSSHKYGHIFNQSEWGKQIVLNGGEWYIITSVSEFWDVVNKKKPEYTLKKVRELLNQTKTKTIKF